MSVIETLESVSHKPSVLEMVSSGNPQALPSTSIVAVRGFK